MAYFLDALGTVQNSRYKIYFLSSISRLEAFWENRGMDLTFNTRSIFEGSYPKLLTYEKYGFCALIPIPPKQSIFQTVIIEPFRDLIWILFGVSMVCSVAVFENKKDPKDLSKSDQNLCSASTQQCVNPFIE